jgi:hypothetical protein
MTCWSCGNTTPEGLFCGNCGAPTAAGGARPHPTARARRPHAFAADPTQSAVSLHLLTTLLPHLPRDRHRHFVAAAIAAVAILAAVGSAGLVGPGLTATALVPLIFMLYLYEVEVYAGDAVLGLAVFVFATSAGVVWAHLTGSAISHAFLLDVTQGVRAGRLLRSGIGLAVGAQAAMIVVVSLVVLVEPMAEGLDSFVTGALAGMAFAVGLTATNLWPQLRSTTVTTGSSVSGALHLVTEGALVHLIDGLASGLIVATVWLIRTRRLNLGGSRAIPLTSVLVAFAVQGAIGATDLAVKDTTAVFVIYVAGVVLLLFSTRLTLHHLLLAEGRTGEHGPPRRCSHCGVVTPATSFCVNCGIALTATPKSPVARGARP